MRAGGAGIHKILNSCYTNSMLCLNNADFIDEMHKKQQYPQRILLSV